MPPRTTKKTADKNTITIKDTNGIEYVEFPIIPGGGVVVFKARCGKGKTSAIDSIETLLGDKTKKLTARDGTAEGMITGAGVTVTIANSTKRKGTLEVTGLQGRYNVAHLVEPGIADPCAADAARIKVICQLSNAAPETAPFIKTCLAGDEEAFKRVTDPAKLKVDDVVTLAARIKSAFEAEKREHQKSAAQYEADAKAAQTLAGDITIDKSLNVDECRQAVQQALTDKIKLDGAAEAAAKQSTAIEEARQKLVLLEGSETIGKPDALAQLLKQAEADLEVLKGKVSELTLALEKAKQEVSDAESKGKSLKNALETALQRAAQIAEAKKLIEGVSGQAPTPAELADAEEAVSQAEKRLQAAVQQQGAATAIESAKEAIEQRDAALDDAKRWEDAAHATDQVLSDLVGTITDQLQVREGPRLVTQHVTRGEIYYVECSTGERYRIAIPIAVKSLGESDLLCLSQEAWQGAEPQLWDEILDIAREHGVTIYTAQVTGAEQLTAEVYQGAN